MSCSLSSNALPHQHAPQPSLSRLALTAPPQQTPWAQQSAVQQSVTAWPPSQHPGSLWRMQPMQQASSAAPGASCHCQPSTAKPAHRHCRPVHYRPKALPSARSALTPLQCMSMCAPSPAQRRARAPGRTRLQSMTCQACRCQGGASHRQQWCLCMTAALWHTLSPHACGPLPRPQRPLGHCAHSLSAIALSWAACSRP